MTDYTPILHLPEVSPNQEQKEATINTAIAILEAAMNDTLSVSLAAGNVTLNTDQFTKYFHHQFFGQTGTRIVTVPGTPRWFAVENLGAHTIVFQINPGYGMTVELAAGKIGLVVSDGDDLRFVVPDPTGGLGLLEDLSNVSGVPTDGQVLRWVAADSNWEPWTLALAFSQLTDFPGSYAGNPTRLLAVNAAGTGLEWVDSAANVNSFIDLDDVPSSYSGAANRTVKVNSGATGLIFSQPKLTEASDFPSSYTSQGGKFLRVNSTPNAVVFDTLTIDDISNGPGAPATGDELKYLRVNSLGTAWEYASGTGGPDQFYQLGDVPSSYSGQAGKFTRVKASEDGLEYHTPAFKELSDVPSSYSGQAGKFAQVNTGATGLQFSFPTVANLSDGPGAPATNGLKVVRVNTGATALEYVTLNITDLGGFPNSFTGQGGKFLQVNPGGTAVQFVSSSYTTSFIALTDAPSSYSGAANKFVVVDPTATGLIFKTVVVPVNLGDLADVEQGTGTPTDGYVLTYKSGVWQAEPPTGGGGGGSSTFAGLTDVLLSSPTAGQIIVYGAGGKWQNTNAPFIPYTLGQLADVEQSTGTPTDGYVLTYKSGIWQPEPPSAPTTTFLALTDTPSTYVGQEGKYAKVNDSGTALQFAYLPLIPHLLGQLADVEQGTGTPPDGYVLTYKDGVWQAEAPTTPSTTFLALTDTPSSYSGQAGKYTRVNDAGTALQFTTLPTIPHLLGQLADVEDGTGTPPNGYVLTWRDSVWQAEAPTGGGSGASNFIDLLDVPGTYIGSGGELVSVAATEDGLEFSGIPTSVLTIPPLLGAHAYWRVQTSAIDSGTYVGIAELTMYTTVGGTDVTTGGSVVDDGSNFGSGNPANAFDNVPSSSWVSATAIPSGTPWVGYHFASPVAIVEVGIQAPSSGYANSPGAPSTFKVQYSNNGSTWFDAWTVTGEPLWAAGEVRKFTPTGTPGIAFRTLADAPNNYTGKAGHYVKVNDSETGVDFLTPPFIPYLLGQLADVEQGTGTPGQGSFLRYIDGIWQADPFVAGVTVPTIGVSTATLSTYTLVMSDHGSLKRFSDATAVNVTVPPNSGVAFPIGTQVLFKQQGVGQVYILSGVGVTVNFPSDMNARTRAQHSLITLIKVGTNEWDLGGDLAVA